MIDFLLNVIIHVISVPIKIIKGVYKFLVWGFGKTIESFFIQVGKFIFLMFLVYLVSKYT